jgi:hypothetical protein
LCLVDSVQRIQYFETKNIFTHLKLAKANVNTISGTTNLIDGSGRANILLPNGTKLQINDALYSSNSRRNLLSFKDIRLNQYHIETTNEGNIEYLCITSVVSCQKQILERFFGLSSGLYQTTIRTIETNLVLNQKFNDPKTFILWHDRLGHPGSIMMRRIVENSHGHSLKNLKILLPSDNPCVACSQGKLITRPSTTKVNFESPIIFGKNSG